MRNALRVVPIVLYPIPLVLIWSFFVGRLVWYGTWHIGWFIHPDILLVTVIACFLFLRFVYRKYNREICNRTWARRYLTAVDVVNGLVLLLASIPYNWETLEKFCVTVLPTISFAVLNLCLRLVFNRQRRTAAGQRMDCMNHIEKVWIKKDNWY